jgi:biotin synthase
MNITGTEDVLSLSLTELLLLADKSRRKGVGTRIEICGIINAKSGSCSEDCKFCAQSAHYCAHIPEYPLKKRDEIVAAAGTARRNGAGRFGIVTSGRRLTREEIKLIAGAITEIREKVGISVCASLGALEEGSFAALKDAGLTRYHHNIETSERFYPAIVSTHDYGERISTIKTAKKMGFEICSGGIFGMGETWQDRIDMALLLKELGVDSVPLNFLVPIKGTPLENAERISSQEAIRIIALFRILLGDKAIKIAAGRETVLKDFQGLMYTAGANGMMVGGYLTVAGRSPEEDRILIKEIQKLWSEE